MSFVLHDVFEIPFDAIVPGVLVTAGGKPVTVMAFTVSGGVITAIRLLGDQDRLAQAVPSWVA